MEVGVGIWPNAWSTLTTLSIVKATICAINCHLQLV